MCTAKNELPHINPHLHDDTNVTIGIGPHLLCDSQVEDQHQQEPFVNTNIWG